MYRATITERLHQNDQNETIVDGFNVTIERPINITDEEISDTYGPDRSELPHSPHTFTEIGRVSIGDDATAFSVGRTGDDFQGLYYGKQGGPLADGATWVVSSLTAGLLDSKGVEFEISDPRDPHSPAYADNPQPWVVARG